MRPYWDISRTDPMYFTRITNRILANDFALALCMLKGPWARWDTPVPYLETVDRSDLIFKAGVFCLEKKGTVAAYKFFSALPPDSDWIYKAGKLCHEKNDIATAIKLFSAVSKDSKKFEPAYNKIQELERILAKSKEETAIAFQGKPPGGTAVYNLSFFNQNLQSTSLSQTQL